MKRTPPLVRSLALVPGLLMVAMVWLSPVAIAAEIEAEEDKADRPTVWALQSGEFTNTAQTLDRGRFTLHPFFFPSTVGVTDNVDIKFPILGAMAFGTGLSIEYGVVDTSSITISIEPFFQSLEAERNSAPSGWGFDLFSAGATVHTTLSMGSNRLNLGTAGVYNTLTEKVAVPVEVGYDLVISDRNTFQFGVGSNVARFVDGPENLAVMANWTRGWSRYRLSLGVMGAYGDMDDTGTLFAQAPDFLLSEDTGFQLLPHVAMWWKLGGRGIDWDLNHTVGGWQELGGEEGGDVVGSSALHRLLVLPGYSLGLSLGAGLRYLSLAEVPDGAAPRLDMLVMELRRSFRDPYHFGLAPARLDLQVDWFHSLWSRSASTRPRVPVCLYSTWLYSVGRHHSLALSSGLYTEVGLDRFVVDEVLLRRPAGTVGVAGRIGWERHAGRIGWGRRPSRFEGGLYLRGVAGSHLGSDPNHPRVTRFLRLGVEHNWMWGGGGESS